jgi:hypothetical protein
MEEVPSSPGRHAGGMPGASSDSGHCPPGCSEGTRTLLRRRALHIIESAIPPCKALQVSLGISDSQLVSSDSKGGNFLVSLSTGSARAGSAGGRTGTWYPLGWGVLNYIGRSPPGGVAPGDLCGQCPKPMWSTAALAVPHDGQGFTAARTGALDQADIIHRLRLRQGDLPPAGLPRK